MTDTRKGTIHPAERKDNRYVSRKQKLLAQTYKKEHWYRYIHLVQREDVMKHYIFSANHANTHDEVTYWFHQELVCLSKIIIRFMSKIVIFAVVTEVHHFSTMTTVHEKL